MLGKIKEDVELTLKEKRDARGKRLEYRQKLDAQRNDNLKIRDNSLMNRHEIAMNKADLDAYMSGDVNYKTMIPGIQPQAQKNTSNFHEVKVGGSLLSPENIEKQKRLAAFGYNKDVLQKWQNQSP